MNRNQHFLCIVAEPKDIYAIERSQAFKGVYHVLGGLISPLDNISPDCLRIKELTQRLTHETFTEIIIAINSTVEGDTTLLYLSSILTKFNIPFTKLAYGLPMGADISYTDEITLKKAIQGRREIEKTT